jgi:hypothetical protein
MVQGHQRSNRGIHQPVPAIQTGIRQFIEEPSS